MCIHWLYGYRYTVSNFVQYVVTIALFLVFSSWIVLIGMRGGREVDSSGSG